jgi:hypothetical protein
MVRACSVPTDWVWSRICSPCPPSASGIATAIIARAITHVRQQGADQILIGAHVTAPPKRLYAALGFAPVCITREYIKHIDHDALAS